MIDMKQSTPVGVDDLNLNAHFVAGRALEKLLTDTDNVIDEIFFIGSDVAIGEIFVEDLKGLTRIDFLFKIIP